MIDTIDYKERCETLEFVLFCSRNKRELRMYSRRKSCFWISFMIKVDYDEDFWRLNICSRLANRCSPLLPSVTYMSHTKYYKRSFIVVLSEVSSITNLNSGLSFPTFLSLINLSSYSESQFGRSTFEISCVKFCLTPKSSLTFRLSTRLLAKKSRSSGFMLFSIILLVTYLRSIADIGSLTSSWTSSDFERRHE